MNKEIVKFLERREAAWVSTHGPLSEHNGAARTGAPPARANGGPKGSPLISDDGIDSFIDGYSSCVSTRLGPAPEVLTVAHEPDNRSHLVRCHEWATRSRSPALRHRQSRSRSAWRRSSRRE